MRGAIYFAGSAVCVVACYMLYRYGWEGAPAVAFPGGTLLARAFKEWRL